MIDKALISYIKEGISKGYTRDELKKILLENEWTEKEISEAFNALGKSIAKPAERRFTETLRSESTAVKTTLTSLEKDRLLKFIRNALSKDVTKDEIIAALKGKGWPENKIEEAFGLLETKKELTPESTIFQEKLIGTKSTKKITLNLIMSYFISFILITVVISATISLLFYVMAITEYEVVDEETGAVVTGSCIYEDCSDMKKYGFDKVQEKLWFSLRIAAISAFILVGLYALVSFKTALLWIINLLYFVFIAYIAYYWIRFNSIVAS